LNGFINWEIRFIPDNSGQAPSARAKAAPLDGAVKETSETPKDFGICPVCGAKIIKGERGVWGAVMIDRETWGSKLGP